MALKEAVIIYGVLILFCGDCLRDLHVYVPEAVAAGETTVLQCSYNLEHDQLYSFKWYKNKDEFFRYIPKELPNTKYFTLPGLHVDRHRSSIRSMILRNVQPSISDWYRCEVIADAPTYRTLVKSAYMHVIDVPKKSPRIMIEKKRLSPGESLKVFCLSPMAQPAPNITWKLNSLPIKATKNSYISIQNFVTSSGNFSELDRHINEIEKPQRNVNNFGLEERRTVSVLDLRINEIHNRRHEPIKLTCTAEIFHLYSKRVDVSIVTTVDGESPTSENFIVMASGVGADTSTENPKYLPWIMALLKILLN